MKIKELISQYRRDFTALMECEFCGHQEMNNHGYDDRYYHDNVIPNMKCGKCGESTISKGGEIEKNSYTLSRRLPNLIVELWHIFKHKLD